MQGEQLKQLQALLKPIADAPALADEPVKAKVSIKSHCTSLLICCIATQLLAVTSLFSDQIRSPI